jgi:hypothetical protein
VAPRYFTIILLEYRIIRHPRLLRIIAARGTSLRIISQEQRERRFILILERHSKFIALLVADAPYTQSKLYAYVWVKTG